MKKILTILLILIATSAQAAPKYRGTSEALRIPGTPIVQAFDNISTVGATFAINPAFLPDQGSMQIVLNGSPSAYDIVVEGSLVSESGPFVPLLSLTQADLTLGHYALKSIPFAQVRLVSKTGGGSFDVYIIYRGN